MERRTEYYNKLETSKGKSDEHATPDDIQQMARDLMGVEQFDLDPCNTLDNSTNSLRSYTIENSGLDEHNSWKSSSLYVNPPFSLNLAFARKLDAELKLGNINKCVWLAKTDPRCKWSKLLIRPSIGYVLCTSYVKFGGAKEAAPFGICLYLYGDIDLDRATKIIYEKGNNNFELFANLSNPYRQSH